MRSNRVTFSPSRHVYQPFPLHVLPGAIRAFVMESATAIGCDPAFIALPLLAGLAGCIGTSRTLVLKPGTWPEPAILWAAIIGRSGTKKSPGIKAATSAIYEHEALEELRHAKRMRAHREEVATYALRLKAWERAVLKDPRLARPDEPVEPVLRQMIVEDVTIEALAVAHHHNPRGLFVCHDELSGWFAFDRYKSSPGGDLATWLSLHNGGSLKQNRKTGDLRRISLPRTAVSLTGGIQPSVLRGVLTQAFRANGLGPRLLMAMPPERPSPWTDAVLSPEAKHAITVIVKRLRSLRRLKSPEGLLVPEPVFLGPKAKRIWTPFHDKFDAERFAKHSDDLEAVWSKLQGQGARLALVLHLVAWAASGDTPGPPSELGAGSMQGGIELAEWFANEAKRTYAVLDESRGEEQVRLRNQSILRIGGEVSIREWQRSHGGMTAPRARAELDELVRCGLGTWLRSTSGKKGGRPSERYRAHPEAQMPPASRTAEL